VLAQQYYRKFPTRLYQTEIESWLHPRSDNIEFTMRRLREPIESRG
jgi:hypothetical protein